MKTVELDLSRPLRYNLAGKFTAPGEDWVHLTRKLYDYELFVVTEGVLYIADTEEKYVIEKGNYLLMPPTAKQQGYKAGACSFYWLHFSTGEREDGRCVPETDSETQEDSDTLVPLCGKVYSMERMVILMKQLQDSERRYGMRSLNDYITSAILAELSAQSLATRKSNHPDHSPQLYNDIVEYISLNVYGELKVSEVAAYFGYNEKYLTTYFKKWAKVSMKQYMLQIKMEHAKAELGETNHGISQIGYALGYSDPHNFSNAFKKVVGLTPREYRDSYAKRRLNQ